MTIIYYANGTAVTEDGYAAIWGYDLAGNLIATIDYGLVPSTPESHPRYVTWHKIGTYYDRAGVAYPPGSYTPSLPIVTPYRIVVDQAGFLYVASSYILSGVIEGLQNGYPYYDWFRKYRRNGDRIPFPQLHGGAIEALALTADGSIVVGGAAVGTGHCTLRKYDADGALLWSAAGGDAPSPEWETVVDVALDAAEDVYILLEYSSLPGTGGTVKLAKYDGSDGSLLWRRWILGSAARHDTIVLYDGHVYLPGYWKFYCVDALIITLPPNIETADTAEVVAYERIAGAPQRYWITQWAMSDGSFVGGMSEAEADPDIEAAYYLSWCPVNLQFLLSVYTPSAFLLQTYEADFTFVSEIDVSTYVPPGIRIDSAGNRFWIKGRDLVNLGIDRLTYDTIYGAYHFTAIDVDGLPLWQGLNARGTPGFWWDGGPWPDTGYVGWTLGGVTYSGTYLDMHNAYDNIPELGAFSFTIPIPQTIYDVCVVENTETPALAFPISLGAFTWEGDRYALAQALPFPISLGAFTWLRDYVGARGVPTIYRAVLTGAPDLDLPLKSFQCRRTAEGQTLITLIVPSASLALLEAITARSSGDLIIRKGVRFSAQSEQIDELLRVALTDVRFDAGATSASVSLSGSDATETPRLITRALRGISYRNTDGDGVRRVRCEMDTWLRPGDTADLGNGETFVVSDLVYSVSPTSAVMEVVERAV